MKKTFFTKNIIIIVLIPIIIIILYAGINFAGMLWGENVSANGQWLSDQTNFIQQLYWPSYCVQIAEKNNIAIDNGYKMELKKYINKLLSKRTFNEINASFLLGQLLWLNDYYKLEFRSDLIFELEKYYDKNTNLFSQNKIDPKSSKINIYQIDTSYEIYQIIQYNPENLFIFNLTKGFSEFLAQSNFDSYSRGQVGEVAAGLIESGNQNLFDKNKIYSLIIEKTDTALATLDESLTSGKYIINLSMVLCAKDFSDFKMYFENDNRYINLSQEIYNKLITNDLIGYDKNNPLFGLFLSMIGNEVDLKQNQFIASHYNEWLVENFHYSLENNLIKALGK